MDGDKGKLTLYALVGFGAGVAASALWKRLCFGHCGGKTQLKDSDILPALPYERDLRGYGATPPDAQWPNAARIAVNFVVNVEEGGENCVLDGDEAAEHLLSDVIGAVPYIGERHVNVESMYEYGTRAGFWRIFRLLEEHGIRATSFCVARALERVPEICEAMQRANWEIASHGYRWIDYQHISPESERKHIQEVINVHERLFGEKPRGIYQGKPSERTRPIVCEFDNFLYDCDSYADDVPYLVDVQTSKGVKKDHVIVPYTLETNDMRFVAAANFANADEYFAYLRDAFDTLYREGGRMMTIGLHGRVAGRPARVEGLRKFIAYAKKHEGVWFATREEIALHWKRHVAKCE